MNWAYTIVQSLCDDWYLSWFWSLDPVSKINDSDTGHYNTSERKHSPWQCSWNIISFIYQQKQSDGSTRCMVKQNLYEHPYVLTYCTFPRWLVCRMPQSNCTQSASTLAYRLFRFLQCSRSTATTLLDQLSGLLQCSQSNSCGSTFILEVIWYNFTLWLGILPFRSHSLDSLPKLTPVVVDFAESMAQDNGRVNPMCDHRCKNVIRLWIDHNFFTLSIHKR